MMMQPVFIRTFFFFPFPQHQRAQEIRRTLFSSSPGYPLALAVNKSPSVAILYAHSTRTEKGGSLSRLMVMVSKCTLVPRLAPVRFTDKTEIQENRNSGLLVLTCFVCSSLSLLIRYPKLQFMSFRRKEGLYSARVLLAGHCFPLQLTCSTEKAIIGNTLLWK